MSFVGVGGRLWQQQKLIPLLQAARGVDMRTRRHRLLPNVERVLHGVADHQREVEGACEGERGGVEELGLLFVGFRNFVICQNRSEISAKFRKN